MRNHRRTIGTLWRGALAAAFLTFGLMAATPSAKALCIDPPHDGLWVNVDPNTRGITRAVVEFTCVDVIFPGHPIPPSWHVTLWGKCHPFDCPWGRVPATSAGSPTNLVITARYNQGFARRRVTITHIRRRDRLRIRIRTDFRDPGRRDYTATYIMRHP
jgi:hypothetical protein